MTQLLRAPARPPRPLPKLPFDPRAIERDYYRTVLRPLIERYERLIQDKLIVRLPDLVARARLITQDSLSLDIAGDLNNVFAILSSSINNLLEQSRLVPAVTGVADQLSRHSAMTAKRQLEHAASVDLGRIIGEVPGLRERVDLFTRENVGLIKSIPTELLTEVEGILTRGIRQGKNARTIAQEIEERFDVSRSRARLIADDQVGKFHGELRRERHTSLGIDSYIWRTIKDKRVRKEHRVREGKKFFYNKPPPDGHPGEPVRCRCFEEPILPI